MRVLPKPEIILTHESDLDGLLSSMLLKSLALKLFKVEVPVEAYNYQNWKLRELREKSAWVCDLAFEARLDKPDWLVIDHHATEAVPKSALLIHDLTQSAGSLCYGLCRENGMESAALDRLVHLNNIADLFITTDPEFDLASDYANLVKTYQFWNLLAVLGGKIESLLDHSLIEVMSVKRRIEDPLGFNWSSHHVLRLSQTVGYVPTVIGNNNLIVHQMLEQRATPYPVLLTLFKKANNTVVASLRSRDGEALKVAEKLQGGGHPNAAGATLPRSVRSIDDAVAYLRQTLESSPLRNQPFNNLDGLLADLKPPQVG